MTEMSRKKMYQSLLGRIPYHGEEDITKLANLSDFDLRVMNKGLTQISGRVREYSKARTQACHAVAAYAWLKNPGWEILRGFAYCDEGIPSCSSWNSANVLSLRRAMRLPS